MRTRPDELCEAFEQGIKGQADIDVVAVVDAIVLDIIDSAGLAMEEAITWHFQREPNLAAVAAHLRAAAQKVVTDYYANHYGEMGA